MGTLPPGLAAYMQKKHNTNAPANMQTATTSAHPMVPMSPAMVSSIRSAKKGVIPPGLAKYIAAKKAAKTKGGK